LSVGREKGSDVADRIVNAAVISDLLCFALLTRGQLTGVSLLSLIADDLAGIEADKYYIKSDIDKCVENMENYFLWFVASPLVPIISCQNLKKDGIIWGDPLPSI
jgi:small lipoprotein (TIGR04452 family)